MNASSFSLALLVFGSFALGLSGDSGQARAVDPNPCPQYVCRNAAAVWDGGKLGINAWFVVGTSPLRHMAGRH